MGRGKTKHKKDGLTSRVSSAKIQYDDLGAYISYCDFCGHRGVVEADYVCMTRKCEYYKRAYIESVSPVFQDGRII